jgi:hypothetical protein
MSKNAKMASNGNLPKKPSTQPVSNNKDFQIAERARTNRAPLVSGVIF